MSESIPITADGPHLEGVFGPLSSDEDRSLRTTIIRLSAELVGMAQRLGGRAGWSGTGFELEWAASGQTSINAFVDVEEADRYIEFSVEVRPSWYFGERSDERAWFVDERISVRCAAPRDCGMHDIVSTEHRVRTVPELIAVLDATVARLVALSKDHPLAHWIAVDPGCAK